MSGTQPANSALGPAAGAAVTGPVMSPAVSNAPAGMPVYSLGAIQAGTLKDVLERERERDQALNDMVQATPLMTGIAAEVHRCWEQARIAKMNTVENRMIENMRARRGEYDPQRLLEIRKFGGSEVFVGITGIKCRAAGSWIRDVVMGQGSDRPWTISPPPDPDMSPDLVEKIVQKTQQALEQAMQQGLAPTDAQAEELMRQFHASAMNELHDDARKASERMADKMETQLVEGGWLRALDQFIDDLTTYPSAIMRGPVVRRKKRLRWDQAKGSTAFTPVVEETFVMEWERVDPFDIYPSPAATTPDEGYLLHRHRLSRRDLTEMIGVQGYSEAAIRACLEDYGRGGLHEWLTNDANYNDAKGLSTTAIANNSEGLIDALQYWGSIQGQYLIDWGMDAASVPDPQAEYDVEVWVIGSHVIKAVLNEDPLHHRGYYKASYEEVPGSFWGRSVADLVRPVQIVCNATARALVNNMGLASGPQVGVRVDMLAPGEEIENLMPWKIWQLTGNAYGQDQGMPIQFYQPQSNAQELSAIFSEFSNLADEYSGVPRYMAGEAPGGGLGRTASGLSMMMGNAGKAIKQVISNMDHTLIAPVLQRLYFYNMQYSNDPDLKGAASIVARGANSLIAKENAQVRRNEFLAATANPIDMQIVGVPGRAAILREIAKGLDMDVDRIVPPPAQLAQRLMAQQPPPGAAPPGAPPQPGAGPGGPRPGAPQPNPTINAQALHTGAPVTDHFTPPGHP